MVLEKYRSERIDFRRGWKGLLTQRMILDGGHISQSRLIVVSNTQIESQSLLTVNIISAPQFAVVSVLVEGKFTSIVFRDKGSFPPPPGPRRSPWSLDLASRRGKGDRVWRGM